MTEENRKPSPPEPYRPRPLADENPAATYQNEQVQGPRHGMLHEIISAIKGPARDEEGKRSNHDSSALNADLDRVVFHTDRYLNLIDVNQKAIDFFALDDRWAGKNMIGTIVPEDEESVRVLYDVRHSLVTKADRFRNIVVQKDRDRKCGCWMSLSVECVRDEKDQLTRLRWTGRDISSSVLLLPTPVVTPVATPVPEIKLTPVPDIVPEPAPTAPAVEIGSHAYDDEDDWLFGDTVPIPASRPSIKEPEPEVQEDDRSEHRALMDMMHAFNSVLESTDDGILMLDQDGTVIQWNEAWARITNLSSGEALGKTLPELERYLPGIVHLHEWLQARSQNKGMFILQDHLELDFTTTHGIPTMVGTKVFPIPSEKGDLFLAVMHMEEPERDLVDRSLYQNLVEHSPDIIFTLDSSGDLAYCNRAFEVLTGKRWQDLIGQNVVKVLPDWGSCPPLGTLARTPFDLVVEGHNGSRRVFRLSSTKLPVDHSTIQFHGREVTELLSLSDELRDNDALMHRLLDLNPEPLFMVDRNGQVTLANDAALNQFLIRPGQQTWYEIVKEEDREAAEALAAESWQSGSVRDDELHLTGRDGTDYVAHVDMELVLRSPGHAIGNLILVRRLELERKEELWAQGLAESDDNLSGDWTGSVPETKSAPWWESEEAPRPKTPEGAAPVVTQVTALPFSVEDMLLAAAQSEGASEESLPEDDGSWTELMYRRPGHNLIDDAIARALARDNEVPLPIPCPEEIGPQGEVEDEEERGIDISSLMDSAGALPLDLGLIEPELQEEEGSPEGEEIMLELLDIRSDLSSIQGAMEELMRTYHENRQQTVTEAIPVPGPIMDDLMIQSPARPRIDTDPQGVDQLYQLICSLLERIHQHKRQGEPVSAMEFEVVQGWLNELEWMVVRSGH